MAAKTVIVHPHYFDTAYAGSMFEKDGGDHVRRDDPESLAAALLECSLKQWADLEDAKAELVQLEAQRDALLACLQACVARMKRELPDPINDPEIADADAAIAKALGETA